jgi:hypothetical protein
MHDILEIGVRIAEHPLERRDRGAAVINRLGEIHRSPKRSRRRASTAGAALQLPSQGVKAQGGHLIEQPQTPAAN